MAGALTAVAASISVARAGRVLRRNIAVLVSSILLFVDPPERRRRMGTFPSEWR
jgi:hypothetical protein